MEKEITQRNVESVESQGVDLSMSKSSVEITKNSRGVNFKVKIVSGELEEIDKIKDKAIQTYNDLEKEFSLLV